MKTQACLGCDGDVTCQEEDKTEIVSFFCDQCGHYKVEKAATALYGTQRHNQIMKKNLHNRLIKTKDSHNRVVTTKQKMKKMKKEGLSFIITLDDNSPENVELWNVQQVGSVVKISLGDER